MSGIINNALERVVAHPRKDPPVAQRARHALLAIARRRGRERTRKRRYWLDQEALLAAGIRFQRSVVKGRYEHAMRYSFLAIAARRRVGVGRERTRKRRYWLDQETLLAAGIRFHRSAVKGRNEHAMRYFFLAIARRRVGVGRERANKRRYWLDQETLLAAGIRFHRSAVKGCN